MLVGILYFFEERIENWQSVLWIIGSMSWFSTYFHIRKHGYVTVSENEIRINQRIIKGVKTINSSEIRSIEKNGKKIKFELLSGKKYKIHIGSINKFKAIELVDQLKLLAINHQIEFVGFD